MKILECIYQKIMTSYPVVPPENGGILGMKNGIVCEYQHDAGIQSLENAQYTPNIEWMNSMLEQWSNSGIQFGGIVHSHPLDQPLLSGADRSYIQKIMFAMPASIDHLFFPVVIPGQGFSVNFAYRQGGQVIIQTDSLEIITETTAVRS